MPVTSCSAAARFVYTTPSDPLAQPLVQALAEEYERRYGDFYRAESAVPEMQKYPAELFAPPHGNFVLLVEAGQPIAGGAFKRLDAQTAEIKRVWTDANRRRQGLARRVLEELEAQAHRQGYAQLFLTTGCRQPEAVGLYLGAGYTPLFDPKADWEALRKLPFRKPLPAHNPVHTPAEAASSYWAHRAMA